MPRMRSDWAGRPRAIRFCSRSGIAMVPWPARASSAWTTRKSGNSPEFNEVEGCNLKLRGSRGNEAPYSRKSEPPYVGCYIFKKISSVFGFPSGFRIPDSEFKTVRNGNFDKPATWAHPLVTWFYARSIQRLLQNPRRAAHGERR